jgi:hypothetical protein
MERDEFDALTAEDARAEAAGETDPHRRSAWLQVASEVDALGEGRTIGELPQARSGWFYSSTGAVYADVTPDLLSRSMKDPDLTKARNQREEDT